MHKRRNLSDPKYLGQNIQQTAFVKYPGLVQNDCPTYYVTGCYINIWDSIFAPNI